MREKYGLSSWELLKACFSREWLLMKRNSFIHIFKSIQIAIIAVMAFTVLLKTEMKAGQRQDADKLWGAPFFSLMAVMLNGMEEITMTIFRLPVFFRQRDSLFYPAWAFGFPIWLLCIPISVIESGIWFTLKY